MTPCSDIADFALISLSFFYWTISDFETTTLGGRSSTLTSFELFWEPFVLPLRAASGVGSRTDAVGSSLTIGSNFSSSLAVSV